MTSPVPKASESGMLRRGSFTSPAVNVMLFQASAEKSEPVCATQMPTNRPNAVAAVKPGTILQPAARRPEVAEVVGAPRRVPADDDAEQISAMSAPVFAVVKTFWMILP
jgi:hypothetical protein